VTALALVDRDALEDLIDSCYSMLSGSYTPDIQDVLQPDDPIVVVSVDAGLRIPGPTAGPPPPPPWYGGVCALTYRAEGDSRLRCFEDGKVVYTSMDSAQSAADLISQREPMRAYLGPKCGHYHVSRRKR
jgi:hypothetical protein